MQYEGVLTKLRTEIGNPIQYYLIFENNFLNLNQLLNKTMEINFLGYQCLNCGKEKKIFRQGFCYDCYYSVPQAGDWIFRPGLSKAHLGIEDRDLAYEEKSQLQPHIVYLASSGNVKVGITKRTQVPTRWIDQGASEAIVILEVPNRYLAGITEVSLKKYFVDKTNWRKMLLNETIKVNLEEEKSKLEKWLPDEVKEYFNPNKKEYYVFDYPVLQYPKKINSINLEKSPFYRGKLMGIKGQYLLFEDGIVFNIRNFEGYVVSIGGIL